MSPQPRSLAMGPFPEQIEWDGGYAFASNVPGLTFDGALAETRRI